MPSPARPDPLSPQARAILEAPNHPRFEGELTPELAQAVREQARAGREPKIAAETAARGVTVTWLEAGGVPVARVLGPGVIAEPAPARALFLHGGGFTGGLAHDMSSVLLAEELGFPVYSVDYPLAPEQPYPAAVDAALAAYLALEGELGGPWVVLGVSAGANLALALTQRLRAEGRLLPIALGLFSPWADLVGHGDSRASNAGRDPVLQWVEELAIGAAAYAGGAPLDDPLLSPVFAYYDAAFPPSILTTGTRDVFLSDCVRLYWALRRAGATAELRVWEDLWHAFNTQPGVPEAAEARSEVVAFVLEALRRRGAAEPPRPA